MSSTKDATLWKEGDSIQTEIDHRRTLAQMNTELRQRNPTKHQKIESKLMEKEEFLSMAKRFKYKGCVDLKIEKNGLHAEP